MSNANWQSLLTIPEKNTYLDLFKKIDADNKGIILQDETLAFLRKSSIPENILMQFWNAVDNDKKGFLTEQEFCTILKLIACAQNGIMTTEPILATKAPLPDFSGNVSGNIQQQSSPVISNTDVITPEDRLKYMNIFQSLNPVNNILHGKMNMCIFVKKIKIAQLNFYFCGYCYIGEQAKITFMRSGLPPTILQHIWNLADARKSGSLNQTEFIIAMHYIESAMKGVTNLPATLPANIYASATGRSIAPSPLVRNNTLRVNSPPLVPMRSPVFKGNTIRTTDITSEELDSDNLGYVSGSDAVVFFKHSKLPESDLARIWDLADTNSTGQLNEEEFAIAMHLINYRIAGGELSNALPTFSSIPSHNHTSQALQLPPPPQQQQQQNIDLLGLDSDFTGTAAPSISQQHQLNQNDLAKEQSILQSNTISESTRVKTIQSQLHIESQAVQDLQKQIDQQKEALSKLKQEADEAERQLEAEKKKKEELTRELQMYKQEIKHYTTRIENAQGETNKLKKENEELEKEKQAKAASPTSNNQNLFVSPFGPTSTTTTSSSHDFFTLSTPHLASSGGELFAKVTEPHETVLPVISHHTGSTINSQQQPKFDPFAGFKAGQQKQSPTLSLNKLKEENEQQKSSVSPNVDISEIESKFPDLNTMEHNFAAAATTTTTTTTSPTLSSIQPTTTSSTSIATITTSTSPKNTTNDLLANLFKKPSSITTNTKMTSGSPTLKNDPNSNKYGFDLSAFEPPSTTSQFNTNASVKDELSSLFGSPSTANSQLPEKQHNTSFDDIFGSSSTHT
ncbi:uncharacterized protein BX663DRAFT_519194 [Cokeromyces recurvatus]|uniref:uncharacterized protein n=1 Tax=Cokeromyces recurvatus TaxID=90255 RepID=UPI00221E58F3|nr:uncharacterized protein BX663DRAFT_519194 [Cokeromyces recurvatus]KAI7899982.1 hypothetical protein BX663DRAFT_519194 [Cokeromyces recurvatus]